jgi:hypothetical protein
MALVRPAVADPVDRTACFDIDRALDIEAPCVRQRLAMIHSP